MEPDTPSPSPETNRKKGKYRGKEKKRRRYIMRHKMLLLQKKRDKPEDLLGLGMTYDALINASVDNSILKFGSNHPFFLPSELLIRESYVKLHDIIHEDPKKSALILGNPGIGKSYFSFYELFRLLHDLVEKKSKGIIVYESVPADLYMVLNAERVVKACSLSHRYTEPQMLEFPKPNKDCSYYLFDAGTKGRIIPEMTPCKAIMFSLPDKDNYQDFLKQEKHIQRLYMPVWSLEELKLLSSEEGLNVEERCELFGGIPRYVLNTTHNEGDIDRAIGAVNDTNAFQVIGESDVGEERHKIFHLIPDATFKHYTAGFASRPVAKKYFERVEKLATCSPLNILANWRGESFVTAARGQLFEMWAHKKLVKGGDFTVRCLETGTMSQLKLSPMRSASFSNLQELKEIHSYNEVKYLQPTQNNFVAVDSFAGDKLFQMTVAKQHPLKVDGLNKSLEAIGRPPIGHFSLYFVVPDDIFNDHDAFKQKQNYLTKENRKAIKHIPPLVQGIKQYALCLPLREIVPM